MQQKPYLYLLFFFCFGFFIQNNLAQSLDKDIILKTHPLAWSVKDFNLGVEIQKNVHWRYTLGLWGKNHSFEEYQTTNAGDRKGISFRLGAKYFPGFIDKKIRFYIEPQLRLHVLKGSFQDDGDGTKANEQEYGGHLATLFGLQYQNRPKSLVFDIYGGLGLFGAKINSTVIGGNKTDLYGKKLDRSAFLPALYFGTAVGLNLRKSYQGDEKYKEVIEAELVISKHKGFYGFKNKYGFLAVPHDYTALSPFREGVALAQKNGKYGYINVQNQAFIAFQYDAANSFSDGMAAVQQQGKWGFIAPTGKTIIPLEYDHADSFKEGMALVQQGEKWFYINKLGTFVKEF
jgi:hypothetical protein